MRVREEEGEMNRMKKEREQGRERGAGIQGKGRGERLNSNVS